MEDGRFSLTFDAGISNSARAPFSKAKKQQNREETLAMRITFVDAF